jgi:hypothetical protein
MTDDVLQGVREAREAFARLHNYDAYAMVAALRQLNEADDRPVVRLPPRPATDAADTPPNPFMAPIVK